jgi:NAD-dependent SIR2 family protein deacetylase
LLWTTRTRQVNKTIKSKASRGGIEISLLHSKEIKKRKCNKCKKNYDYILVGIAIDENLIYLCDTCLQEINRSIVDYLASKYI